MDYYPALSMLHAVAATLLFSLTTISILISAMIAVKRAADPANERLTAISNKVRLVEIFTTVLVAVTGLIVMLMGPWALSQFWLRMSLLLLVFYGLTLLYVTKPPRQFVSRRGRAVKVAMQAYLQFGQFLLLLMAFVLMVVKPSF